MLQLPPEDRIAALHDDAKIRDVFSRKVKQFQDTWHTLGLCKRQIVF
jgi:hypothetical protein